jgi:Ni/Co efflux regulator RcnB
LYDHHAYHLHAPPRGYHWVRVNHDVVLAAIATGIVLEVLYNHFD